MAGKEILTGPLPHPCWPAFPSLSPDTSWSLTLGHHQADRMEEQNRVIRGVINHAAVQSRVRHSKISHLDMQHGLPRVIFQCVLPHVDLSGICRWPLCDHQCQGLLSVRQPLPSLLAAGILPDVEGTAHRQGLSLDSVIPFFGWVSGSSSFCKQEKGNRLCREWSPSKLCTGKELFGVCLFVSL